MRFKNIILLIVLILATSLFVNAQKTNKADENKAVKSSPAYAEVLYRKVQVKSELEDLLVAYTDEFPKVKELRVEEDYLKQELKRLLEVKSVNAEKLSPALGKLIVEKVSLEMELWNILQQYNDEHPEVKKAKRKIEIFENAIKEIL